MKTRKYSLRSIAVVGILLMIGLLNVVIGQTIIEYSTIPDLQLAFSKGLYNMGYLLTSGGVLTIIFTFITAEIIDKILLENKS